MDINDNICKSSYVYIDLTSHLTIQEKYINVIRIKHKKKVFVQWF
jgi:hypothetical protein